MAGTAAEVQILLTMQDRASALLAAARGNVGRFAASLGAQTTQARGAMASLDGLRRSLREFAQSSQSGLAPLLAAGGMAAVAGTLVSIGVGFNSLREQALIAFEQIYGSSTKALAFFEQLKAVALETPFQFGDVVQIGQRLAVVGYKAEEVTRLVRLFSDVISSIPNAGAEQLDSITMAFARMREAGVAGLGDIQGLSAMGIPALQILAEQFGTTTRGMRRILMRDLPSELIMSRLETGLAAHFGGMGQKQVATFRGTISNIRDIVTQDLGQVMLPFFVRLEETLRRIVRGLADLKLWMQQLPQPVKDAIREFGPWLLMLIPLGLALGGISTAISGLLTVLGPIAAVVGAVLLVLEPFGLLIAGLAIIVYTLYLAWTQNWFGIRDAVIGAWAVIAPILQAVWDFLVKLGTGQISLSLVLDATWQWIRNLISTAGTAIQLAFAATMADPIGTAWAVVKWIAGLLGAVAKFSIEGWLKVVGLGWADVEWLMGQVGTAAKFAWDTTVNLVGDGWGWVTWLAGQVAAAIAPAWSTTVALVAGGWDWIIWLAGQIAAPIAPAWSAAVALLAGGWDWIIWLAGQIATPIAPAWDTVIALVGEGWAWVQWLGSQVATPIAVAWDTVISLLAGGWDWVKWLADQFTTASSVTWDALVALVGDAWEWVKWLAGKITTGVSLVFSLGLNLIGDAWDLIKKLYSGVAAVVNVVTGGGGGGGAQPAPGHGTSYYPDYPGGPSVAHSFDDGGIATQPMLGMLHKNEAVVPLDRLSALGAGAGGASITVNVYGPMLGQDLEDVIVQQIDNARRRARLPAGIG